jgi:hypothetical protein
MSPRQGAERRVTAHAAGVDNPVADHAQIEVGCPTTTDELTRPECGEWVIGRQRATAISAMLGDAQVVRDESKSAPRLRLAWWRVILS